jgi:DNA invertase Pin-like site-specific DNA recombinase
MRAVRSAVTGDAKIAVTRTARRAIVYVRQSSSRQVEHSRESQELQYALVDRARALGWKRVEVIDDDLGVSAGAVSHREGFEKMLAAVALEDVGIILSREASRLSRNDTDWCRLLELCQVFGTLIGDADNVYDLSSLDDQLVLGIKGTMSVVELKILRQRLTAGMFHKASKGEFYAKIAPGYVLDVDRRLVKDPNERAQKGIEIVFTTFRRLPSVRQTLLWLREHDVELPVNEVYDRTWRIVFRVPAYSLVSSILHNPVYAGAYVYGRRPAETRVVDGLIKKRHSSPLPPDRSRVFLRDHHEPYITWTEFEENQRTMRNNTHRWGTSEEVGAVRRGQGLLVGLLRCGRCGRKLHVRYWGKSGTNARYLCKGDYESGGKYCLGFGGAPVDRRIAEDVLGVVSPLGIEASIEAARLLESTHDDRRALLAKQLEQAEYDARRAFEQYDVVDARNRLVAATLETRWNEKLRDADAVRASIVALDSASSRLSDPERMELRAMGTVFRDVWSSTFCPPELRKRIVRAVLEEVVVSEEPRGTLRLVVHWKGRAHTLVEMPRPRSAADSRNAPDDIDIIRRMAVRYGDGAIATVLNKLGRHTGKGRRWTTQSVQTARSRSGIDGQTRSKIDPDVLTLNAAAHAAGVSDTTIRTLVSAAILPCTRLAPLAPWEIRRADLESDPVRCAIEKLRRTGTLGLKKAAVGGAAGPEQTLLLLESQGNEGTRHHE